MNKIALAPTSLPDTPALEYIDAAAAAGYDGIGLRLFRSPGITYPFHPVTHDPQLMQQVKRAIESSGLEVMDVLSFYMQAETDFEPMMAPLNFAREIGARYVLVIGDDPEWDRMVQNFGRFCDIAGGLELTPALEAPVVRREINTLEKATDLIEQTGRRGVICLDPYHFHRLEHTPDRLKGIDPALYPYSQITDGFFDLANGGRTGMGAGEVPLPAILDALPPELPLSLEWPAPPGSSYTPREWAKHALDDTKRWLTDYYARKS